MSGLPECTGSHGHDWKTLMAHVKGRGHGVTEVQEMCLDCGILRLNPDREVYVSEYGSTMTARVKDEAWREAGDY